MFEKKPKNIRINAQIARFNGKQLQASQYHEIEEHDKWEIEWKRKMYCGDHEGERQIDNLAHSQWKMPYYQTIRLIENSVDIYVQTE